MGRNRGSSLLVRLELAGAGRVRARSKRGRSMMVRLKVGYRCRCYEGCFESFGNKKELKSHVNRRHFGWMYQSKRCKERCFSLDDLKSHYRRYHSNHLEDLEGILRTPRFSQLSNISPRTSCVGCCDDCDPDRQYVYRCSDEKCSRVFQSAVALQQHVQQKHKVLILQKLECSAWFTTTGRLVDHFSAEHPNEAETAMSQSRLPASWNPESSAQKMLCDERDSEGEPVCFGGTTPNPQGPLCKEAEEQESTTLIVQDGERSNSELALAGIARRVSYDIASIAEQREAARRSLEILRSSGSRGWCREENGRQSIAAEGSINRQREAANLVLSLFGSNEPGGMYRE